MPVERADLMQAGTWKAGWSRQGAAGTTNRSTIQPMMHTLAPCHPHLANAEQVEKRLPAHSVTSS